MSAITATRIAASRLTYQRVRRARTVSSIVIAGFHTQRIPGAAPRLNQLHAVAIVDLAAKPLDVDLDQIRHRVETVVPDVLGDVGPAGDLTAAPQQMLEQRVFRGGEGDRPAGARDAPRAGVDGQVLDRQLRRLE